MWPHQDLVTFSCQTFTVPLIITESIMRTIVWHTRGTHGITDMYVSTMYETVCLLFAILSFCAQDCLSICSIIEKHIIYMPYWPISWSHYMYINDMYVHVCSYPLVLLSVCLHIFAFLVFSISKLMLLCLSVYLLVCLYYPVPFIGGTSIIVVAPTMPCITVRSKTGTTSAGLDKFLFSSFVYWNLKQQITYYCTKFVLIPIHTILLAKWEREKMGTKASLSAALGLQRQHQNKITEKTKL